MSNNNTTRTQQFISITIASTPTCIDPPRPAKGLAVALLLGRGVHVALPRTDSPAAGACTHQPPPLAFCVFWSEEQNRPLCLVLDIYASWLFGLLYHLRLWSVSVCVHLLRTASFPYHDDGFGDMVGNHQRRKQCNLGHPAGYHPGRNPPPSDITRRMT